MNDCAKEYHPTRPMIRSLRNSARPTRRRDSLPGNPRLYPRSPNYRSLLLSPRQARQLQTVRRMQHCRRSMAFSLPGN